MKKNGFVSTSIIYTFFVIFLILMLFLLNSYSRVRFLLEDYKYDIKNNFAHLSTADVNLYFLTWDVNRQEYEYVDEMPTFGYEYESEFSYCKNGSNIAYQNGNVSVTVNKKDTCYAYFKEKDKDIILKIYRKESESGQKTLVNSIPNEAYKLTSSYCTNNATIEFNESTRKFKISSQTKTECSVEFTKKDMDVVLNIYKQTSNGTYEYDNLKFSKTNEMPGSNYSLYKYVCKNNTTISEINNELVLTTSGKDECNVYYTSADFKVEIIMMQETENGVSGYTTGKLYSRVYQTPVTNFYYVGYICEDSSATVKYENGTFIGESNNQTVCRVYFNQSNNNSVNINYFLEKSDGTYESVANVPEIGYVFNSKKSGCEKGSSYQVVDNYVIVSSTTQNEVCNFYFDLANPDIQVLVYVMNRSTEKYELGSVPAVGYSMYSSGCTNSASIEYKNSQLLITSDGPTTCTVYFR